MADKALIEKFLPEDLWEIAMEYDIPGSFLETKWDLIQMILLSKSIDTKEEKQNWFNLMPMMNQTQIDRLRGILDKEKRRLSEIEQKYQKRKQEIKNKYMKKRDDMWYVNKVNNIKDKEEDIVKKDEEEAEELLSMI